MGKFDLDSKGASHDARSEWRKGIFTLNAARRLRFTSNIEKRQEYEKKLEEIHARKSLRTSLTVAQAVIRFERAGHLLQPERDSEELLRKAEEYGFQDGPKELARMVEQDDKERLREIGGVQGLARRLKVEFEEGLPEDSKDTKQRQEVYGTNTYPEKPPKGFWVFVWEAFQDITLLILLVCAVVSLAVGIPTEGLKEGWYDGAGIAFSICLVVFVTAASDYQQSKQFRDLDNEKKKIYLQVTRGGCRKQVLIFDLLVGDVVHLNIGDVVPTDGVYIRGYSLTIDESSMTGESHPQYKTEKSPFLLSGTTVQDGSGLMLVTGVGMNTEWGKLMATLSDDTCEETPLQVRLNGVATLIGKVGLGFAILTFTVLVIRFLINKAESGDLKDWDLDDVVTLVDYFAIAVTIIVVAVPEGLPLAVTLTLAYAMKKMMADKALVRHLSACETMGSATTICSDKTGTLTTNKMTVARTWVAGAERDASEIKGQLPEEFLPILLQSIFLNTTGDVAQADNSLIGTPTETACLGLGVSLGGDFRKVRSEAEILKIEPFNSAKKKMGVVLKNPDGSIRVHWKGASEIVLSSCDKVIDGEGQVVPIDDELNEQLKSTIQSFADNALRTLCLAYTDLEGWQDGAIPSEGFTCAAILGIKDPVRPGVPEAVKTCFAAGIKVRMVTGDNVNTAVAIAKECGILTDGGFIEGPEFRKLYGDPGTDRAYLESLVNNLQVMARSSPTDKHTLVKMLKEMGEVVAVTGDGTNDAPALHEADIGLAMGIAGTEVAKESADVIILDDRFQTIVTQAKWGRAVYTNIQKFVQFQLTVNLVALVINFTSACITGEAPLTAVQLLWVNLIMDTLGALALATEPPTDDLMTKAPVGRKGEFITYVMWRNIIGQVFYQLVVLFILQYKYKDLHFLDVEDKETLNTLIFNTFVFCQVFNEINSREMEKINVFRNTFNNIVFILVLVFTVVFQVIMVEFLGKFAETVPLSRKHWLISVGIGAGGLLVAALVKLIPVPSPRRVTERADKSHQTNGGVSGELSEPLLHTDSGAEGVQVEEQQEEGAATLVKRARRRRVPPP